MPTKPTAPAPRRRGRPPATKGAPDVRERLLDAALVLFSEHGIAGTTLSLVARKARVTPALMHYYFGDKERLIDAAIAERLQPLVMQVGSRLAGAMKEPRRAIETFVREAISTLSAHEWLPGLWLREVVIEGGQLRARMLDQIAPQIAPVVADAARHAQATGSLNPDLEPRLIMVSLIGLAVFPIAAQSIWRRVFDAADITPEVLTRHALALLMRGLELPDETPR